MPNTSQLLPTPLSTGTPTATSSTTSIAPAIPTTTTTNTSIGMQFKNELSVFNLIHDLMINREHASYILEQLRNTTSSMNALSHSYHAAVSINQNLKNTYDALKLHKQTIQNAINNQKPWINGFLKSLAQHHPSQIFNEIIEQHHLLLEQFLSNQKKLLSNQKQLHAADDLIIEINKNIHSLHQEYSLAQQKRDTLSQELAINQQNDELLKNLLSINFPAPSTLESVLTPLSTLSTTNTPEATTTTNTSNVTAVTSTESNLRTNIMSFVKYKKIVFDLNEQISAIQDLDIIANNKINEFIAMDSKIDKSQHDITNENQKIQNIMASYQPETLQIFSMLGNQPEILNDTTFAGLWQEFLSLQKTLEVNKRQLQNLIDQKAEIHKFIHDYRQMQLTTQKKVDNLKQERLSLTQIETPLKSLLRLNPSAATPYKTFENTPLAHSVGLIRQKKVISDLNARILIEQNLAITTQNEQQEQLALYSNLKTSHENIAAEGQQIQIILVNYYQSCELLNNIPYDELMKEVLPLQKALILNQQQLQNTSYQMVEARKLLQKQGQTLLALVKKLEDLKRQALSANQAEAKLLSQLPNNLNAAPYKAFRSLLDNLKPITIQYITVTHPPNSSQTAEIKEPVTEDYFSRILEQIKMDLKLAKSIHQKNCNENNTLKASCHNNITILIRDEFSLYPSEYLTEEKYSLLVKEIYNIVKAAPPNIVLILATIPVLVNKILHSIAICAISGPQACLYHRTKIVYAPKDFDYGCPRLKIDPASTQFTTMQAIDLNGTIKFDHGTLVTIVSYGGVPLLCNIEICLEHHDHFGALCLANTIEKAHNTQEIIPAQYTHIISSNITSVLNDNPFGIQCITQADKVFAGIWAYNNTKYERLHTVESYSSQQPVFGRSSCVTVHRPQTASLLPHSFFNQALESNVALVDQQLKQAAKSNNTP